MLEMNMASLGLLLIVASLVAMVTRRVGLLILSSVKRPRRIARPHLTS